MGIMMLCGSKKKEMKVDFWEGKMVLTCEIWYREEKTMNEKKDHKWANRECF